MSGKYVKRLSLLAAVLLFVIGTGIYPVHQAKAEGIKTGTWLWNTEVIRTSPAEVLAFSEKSGVNSIYLQTNVDIPASYYKSFIKQAAALGIRVEALSGAPAWGLESERYKITNFLDWIEKYQNNAASDERFQGVHVDIEPHVLAQWKNDQDGVVRQWQNNVQYLTDRVHAMNLPAAVDIPFWLCNYSNAEGTGTLSSFMINQFDSVSIMSYRDTAEGIYSTAKRELEEADALGKPAFASVETKPSNEGGFITFYEEGATYMNEQLVKVRELAQSNVSFAGISVHDLDGWKSLRD